MSRKGTETWGSVAGRDWALGHGVTAAPFLPQSPVFPHRNHGFHLHPEDTCDQIKVRSVKDWPTLPPGLCTKHLAGIVSPSIIKPAGTWQSRTGIWTVTSRGPGWKQAMSFLQTLQWLLWLTAANRVTGTKPSSHTQPRHTETLRQLKGCVGKTQGRADKTHHPVTALTPKLTQQPLPRLYQSLRVCQGDSSFSVRCPAWTAEETQWKTPNALVFAPGWGTTSCCHYSPRTATNLWLCCSLPSGWAQVWNNAVLLPKTDSLVCPYVSHVAAKGSLGTQHQSGMEKLMGHREHWAALTDSPG